MFGKKKIATNAYDIKYENLWVEMFDHSDSLTHCTQDVYIKNLCVSLYPDGPDKNRAISDYEKSKETLHRAIATYDTAMHELINFFANHKTQMEKCSTWNPSIRFLESHKIIEVALENLIR